MRGTIFGRSVGFAGAIAAATALPACSSFAPKRLYDDQIGYSSSLADSQKAQTLVNVVRLRYGDFPVFLKTTQVISGYSLQQSLGGTVTPGAGTTVIGAPSVSMGQTPTFTFQPVSGDALAQSFVRPLSTGQILTLGLSGVPIDVLFRLAVQSVNGMQNTTLLERSDHSGVSGFGQLLVNLRTLQKANLLGVRSAEGAPAGDPAAKSQGRIFLTIGDGSDPALRAAAAQTRAALGLRPGTTDAEVVYGRSAPGKIAVMPRSILGVMSYVASEIEVSAADVARGSTPETSGYASVLRRPAVIIRSGEAAPRGAFSAAQYRERWYWIDGDDFDSKVAFSVIQMLMTLSETSQNAGAVLTIPAR